MGRRKKKINWKNRQDILRKLFNKKNKNNKYDCIVPVSGGKDGSYVSYILKKKFGKKLENLIKIILATSII